MGKVTISFLGVCTIFRDLATRLPNVTGLPTSRVVLARATQEFRNLTGVEPHIGKLQFVADEVTFDGPGLPADSPGVYTLDGVGLSIVNAVTVEPPPPPSRGLDCLPSLSAYLQGTIGQPATYVFVPDRANVQAWFDVPGTYQWLAWLMRADPRCPIVPSISVLTMETVGDPVLLYSPWDATRPTRVTLKGDAPNINVMNFAHGEALVEDNNDFMLNYWLTVPFPSPSNIQIPQANACTQESPMSYAVKGCGDAGPGCSNSVYP